MIVPFGSTSGANKIVRSSMDFRLFGETTDMSTGCPHNPYPPVLGWFQGPPQFQLGPPAGQSQPLPLARLKPPGSQEICRNFSANRCSLHVAGSVISAQFAPAGTRCCCVHKIRCPTATKAKGAHHGATPLRLGSTAPIPGQGAEQM